MAMRLYPYFATFMFIVLLIAMYSPWIQGKSESISMSDIIFNLDRLYDIIDFLKNMQGIFPTEAFQEAVNLFILSAILMIITIIVSITGLRFEKSLSGAATLSFVTVFVFTLAYHKLIDAIRGAMGIVGDISGAYLGYGYGLYLMFIAGGIGIVGYLISSRERE